MQTPKTYTRVAIALLCASGLLVVFLMQRTDVFSFLGLDGPRFLQYVINRTVRFLLNDLFAIGLIYALFPERKYVIFALWVQLAGVVFILIPYFVLKYNLPSYNGPLISFLHRLMLNPILLLLLIPSFYYQKLSQQNNAI